MHAHHHHASWALAVDRQPLHLKNLSVQGSVPKSGSTRLQVSLSGTPLVEYETDTMKEDKRVWGAGSHLFSRVPEVLVGGYLLRTTERELPVGTRLSIQCNAAAVVYLLADPHRNGGWDESLPQEGWQCLGQCGPLVSGASRMEMYRFNLQDAQTLHVPATTRVVSTAVVTIQPPHTAPSTRPTARRAALVREMEQLRQELRRKEAELEHLEEESPFNNSVDSCTPPSQSSSANTARSISPEEGVLSDQAEDAPPPMAKVHERGVLGRCSMRVLVEECLGRKMSDREFRDAYTRMDPEGTGGVHVRNFVDWLDTTPATPVSAPTRVVPAPPAPSSAAAAPPAAAPAKLKEVPDHFKVRPCEHNEWDSVRAKQGVALLRCRVCSTPWRTVLSNRDGPALWHRCSAFDRGECTLGPSCPALHVHRRKQKPGKSPDEEKTTF